MESEDKGWRGCMFLRYYGRKPVRHSFGLFICQQAGQCDEGEVMLVIWRIQSEEIHAEIVCPH